jgi:hypothetical protein
VKMRIALAMAMIAIGPELQAAEIFRCASQGGAVSYQELPCNTESAGGRTALPTSFPEIDVAARERLFRREAALDQRLEAERERLSREEMNRVSAAAQVAAAQAAAQAASHETVYAVAWPLVGGYPAARPLPAGRRTLPPPRTLIR